MPALEKFTNRSIGRRREEKNFNLKQASRPWEASGTKVTVTVVIIIEYAMNDRSVQKTENLKARKF